MRERENCYSSRFQRLPSESELVINLNVGETFSGIPQEPLSPMNTPVQTSLFEEDFLIRTIGSIAYLPDAALTELVANAWDAGAAKVAITLPDQPKHLMKVEDDGIGMSEEEFRTRWMMLSYNRRKRQGLAVEFPPERATWKRRAFGRNGVGRHGLLCFANKYEVETYKDGTGWCFRVRTSSGNAPLVLESEKQLKAIEGRHGTSLLCKVDRVVNADEIRELLSARFIHDPRFTVSVNNISLTLTELPGLLDKATKEITDKVQIELWLIDTEKAAKTKRRQGISFWMDGRLIGEPSWSWPGPFVVDGRTIFGKRYSVIVKILADDSFDDVQPDWSGFKRTQRMAAIFQEVSRYVESQYVRLSHERVAETKEQVFRENLSEIRNLGASGRAGVNKFVEEVLQKRPTIDQEVLSTAVQTVINLEGSRRGKALLAKLASMSETDIEGVDRLLSEWTVADALAVLDEIDRRLAVIEAINRFESDEKIDELHTLHPLVTQARWLFGPEFESPEFASNISLRNAVEKVLGEKMSAQQFANPRKRPDLIFLKDSTLSAVALESFGGNGLVSTKEILLLELKRGRSFIGDEELDQAVKYIQAIRGCGLIDGLPRFHAFVVGHGVTPGTEPTRKLGSDDYAIVQAVPYSQLTRTANKRLFQLREKLEPRYSDAETISPELHKILQEPIQTEFS